MWSFTTLSELRRKVRKKRKNIRACLPVIDSDATRDGGVILTVLVKCEIKCNHSALFICIINLTWFYCIATSVKYETQDWSFPGQVVFSLLFKPSPSANPVKLRSWAILRALSDWSFQVTWCRSLDQKEIKITFTAWRETINRFQKNIMEHGGYFS